MGHWLLRLWAVVFALAAIGLVLGHAGVTEVVAGAVPPIGIAVLITTIVYAWRSINREPRRTTDAPPAVPPAPIGVW
jgi:K+ transporter